MKRLICILTLFIISMSSLTGCATTGRGNTNLQTQQLQVRVNNLERESRLKDERIRYLENELKESKRAKTVETAQIDKKSVSIPVATQTKNTDVSSPTPQQLQAALKKAGFYNGPIDGKIGERTTKAIKDFQKANGLVADGVAGKQTWSRLKKYSE